jgi:hypothetical protein
MFQYLLAVRGYRGKLRVDYRSRAIELRVGNSNPDRKQAIDHGTRFNLMKLK